MTEQGHVVAVGKGRQARWMFATKYDLDLKTVAGRLWNNSEQKWGAHTVVYSIEVLAKQRPRCDRPAPPMD